MVIYLYPYSTFKKEKEHKHISALQWIQSSLYVIQLIYKYSHIVCFFCYCLSLFLCVLYLYAFA